MKKYLLATALLATSNLCSIYAMAQDGTGSTNLTPRTQRAEKKQSVGTDEMKESKAVKLNLTMDRKLDITLDKESIDFPWAGYKPSPVGGIALAVRSD